MNDATNVVQSKFIEIVKGIIATTAIQRLFPPTKLQMLK